jgi:hypothetical protein
MSVMFVMPLSEPSPSEGAAPYKFDVLSSGIDQSGDHGWWIQISAPIHQHFLSVRDSQKNRKIRTGIEILISDYIFKININFHDFISF